MWVSSLSKGCCMFALPTKVVALSLWEREREQYSATAKLPFDWYSLSSFFQAQAFWKPRSSWYEEKGPPTSYNNSISSFLQLQDHYFKITNPSPIIICFFNEVHISPPYLLPVYLLSCSGKVKFLGYVFVLGFLSPWIRMKLLIWCFQGSKVWNLKMPQKSWATFSYKIMGRKRWYV